MKAQSEHFEEVVALVHRRDELLDERKRLTAHLDAKISEVEGQLSKLIAAPPKEPPSSKPGRKSDIGQRVLAVLQDAPGIDHAQWAQAVYGESTERTRHRLRAQIDFLKKQGKIRPIPGAPRGKWQVIPDNGRPGVTVQ